MILSYSKPLALTHRQAEPLRQHGPHLLYQEKVDGSQFSFGIFGGRLVMRSRKVEVIEGAAHMFGLAVESVRERSHLLRDGWTYRGEYLRAPKHNTIAYARVPAGHIAIFDVDRGNCDYLHEKHAAEESARIGLEHVPSWRHDGAPLDEWLTRESFLGGAIVEGYVVKDYAAIGADGKVAMAKVVRDSFKEAHSKEWRKANPTRGDIIDDLIAQYTTEARWAKAVQHLREAGSLTDSPQDIGPLLAEASRDFEEECAREIGEALWGAFRKRFIRGATRGLPEWYKETL